MSLQKDKCGKCGAKISPGYDFCLSCGTKFSDVPPLPEGYISGDYKLLFCKKCGKEVKPIKEQKTAGKRTANFFAFLIGAGAVYTYPKRCPYCNKVLRSKTQKTVGIICVIIWITITLIGISLFVIPKYF
jgi:uncharacterized OB-fold protein